MADEANPFAQFASQPDTEPNPFAQFVAEEPNPFQQFVEPPVQPEDLSDRVKKFLFSPKGAQTTRQAIQDAVTSIPQIPVQLAESLYNVARAGFDRGTLGTAQELLRQGAGMGTQIASDIQHPFGSPEFLRGAAQYALMAAPGLEAFRELRVPEIPIEKPPLQPQAGLPPSLGPGTMPEAIARGLEQGEAGRFTLVPEPPPTLETPPTLEETLAQTRGGGQVFNPELGPTALPELHPVSETASMLPPAEVAPPITPEVPIAPPVPEQVPAPETPQLVIKPEEPAPKPAVEPPPVQAQPESGISTERLQKIYGNDAVLVTKGKGAQEWQKIGQADKRDPYTVLTDARQRGIALPTDAPLFRAEHQRLLDAARQSVGTPEYNQRLQSAADFANATKQVVHGPASDIMRGLQDADVPRYDSPVDFDSIIRERLNRESTPEESATFQRVADEVRNGDAETTAEAGRAQNRLRQYRPNETVSFEDAVDSLKEQIKKLTEPCEL